MMGAVRQWLTTFLLLRLNLYAVKAWHKCSSWSSDVCPTGNMCCFHPPTNSYRCLSGKNQILGQCCGDTGRTGCGDGFQCAGGGDEYDEESVYCARTAPDNDLLPERVPRYELCSLPPQALQEVFGLAMMDNSRISNEEEEDGDDDDDDNALRHQKQQSSQQQSIAAAAYLSNMGSLDTDDPILRQAHALVDTAWIVVHGSERNADDYLCCAQQAAAFQNVTFIVAPWFLAPHDNVTTTLRNISATGNNNTQPVVLLRWAEDGPIPHTWRYGADDVTDANISSYAVVDALVDRFLNASQFPLLQRIVVAGHSAGGQFVQRWALLSHHPDPISNNNNDRNVSIRSVVANPKSFVWLDDRRVMEDGVVLRKPDRDAVYLCPMYNEWEWGLQNSTRSTERAALVAPYKDRAIQNAGGTAALTARYASRHVIYLAGELDVLRNGDCEDKMQGRFRFERSAHFFTALREIYGGRPVNHRRLVVTGVHHDHCLMFQSPEGRKALFGNFDSDNEVRDPPRDPGSTASR